MGTGLIILIVIACAFAYFLIGGIMAGLLGLFDKWNDPIEDFFDAIVVLFWPVSIPLLIIMGCVTAIINFGKHLVRERRQS